MVTFKDLERVRRELVKLVEQSIAQVFIYTLGSASSALGDSDAVEKADGATDPDGAKGQRPVVRINPFGFISRTPKGLRQFSIRIGSSNVLTIGIGPQQSYGPQSLNVGETALYNKINGCEVLLDQNGGATVSDAGGATAKLDGTGVITLTDKGGGTAKLDGTGNFIINGGALKIARVTDQVQGMAGPYPIVNGLISGPGAAKGLA